MTQLAFVAPLFLSSSSRAPSFRRPRAPRLTLSPPPTRSAPPSPPRLHPLLSHANRVTVSTVVAAVDRVYSAPGDAYRRFYTLEVLARIPFFAYTCLLHLRETLRGPSDAGTRRLRAHFEQADNEALHLAVMVAMGGGDRWMDQFLARHLSLVYFFVSICVFSISPAVAFHFNELIEIHAYDTYDKVWMFAVFYLFSVRHWPTPTLY